MHVMIRHSLPFALVALLVACGGEREMEAPAAAAEMDDMAGMEGMGGMMSSGIMEQMQTHMQAMHGAGGDSLTAMMPMHRQMTANMIAGMNREMRDMNMAADPEWNATVDSLRQDLIRIPEMDGAELRSYMDGHRARMERLMEMHRGMMRDMEM